MGMLGAIVDVHVADDGTAKTVLGKHAFHYLGEQGIVTGLEVLVESFLHQHFRSSLTLATGIARYMTDIYGQSSFFRSEQSFRR